MLMVKSLLCVCVSSACTQVPATISLPGGWGCESACLKIRAVSITTRIPVRLNTKHNVQIIFNILILSLLSLPFTRCQGSRKTSPATAFLSFFFWNPKYRQVAPASCNQFMYASVCITSTQIYILEMNIIILRLASKYSSCKTQLTKILHGHLKLIFSCNVKIYIHPISCALNGREPFLALCSKEN